jgi:hypothetical protein
MAESFRSLYSHTSLIAWPFADSQQVELSNKSQFLHLVMPPSDMVGTTCATR